MKTSTTILYPNQQVADSVTAYSESRSLELPKEIADYHAWICETQENSNYTISTFQAKSLVFLTRLVRAKRALEIGCYLGFSAAVLSHAVGPDGAVTGLEFSEEYVQTAQTKLAGLGIKNVEFKVGSASDSLESLEPAEPYDIVFIDADKSGYPNYLQKILSRSQPGQAHRILKPGGLIVADNVLRKGLVADRSNANPWSKIEKEDRATYWKTTDLEALDQFNTELAKNDRIDAWLVPLFDGVALGRLRD
ncbi:S-adenosyl-L-methionine-dependent methyltransferase [Phialemonium atrogriseum]|uniref:S-adenosyl-L-methionine-dependent methyltransferase n=1 Tax=Phialemonium atrogriseum TaxID=1093897 RepID=A0AAJ0C692_9PEZI|nr:S-adenosyl-L-methionine-dependent methyltransferase [Phialemonium atrogriseum]KAK1770930.1 S-adenosyl-L-methionine-dependent methyltransferase [Phialemonium atrogriseum]